VSKIFAITTDSRSRTILSKHGEHYRTHFSLCYMPMRGERFFLCYTGKFPPDNASTISNRLLVNGADISWVNLDRKDCCMVRWAIDIARGIA